MERIRGFAVISLLITLVLAAIILSRGIPGSRDVIQNNRAATQVLAGGSPLTGLADVGCRPSGGVVAVRPWRSLVRQS